MKKRLFVFIAVFALVMCLFAISLSAAEPDTSRETFTLSDGTKLPIWDTDGNGLIWYKSTANTEDGYANYDYVHNNQKDTSITPYITYNTWSGPTYNVQAYQCSNFTVTDSLGTHASYGADVVLANMKGSKYNDTVLFNTYNSTFKNATEIEAIYFDECTEVFVTSVMNNCYKLRYVNLHETKLKALGGVANLAECRVLPEIKLPDTLKYIGDWQFQTTAITTFKIPESVEHWGATNFKQCYYLETVEGFEELFERGVLTTVLPANTFMDCNSLQIPFTDGVLPEGIIEIGAYAFDDCRALGTTLILPNTLTTLGQNAFQGCTSLEKVVLGASFTTFASHDAFKNCSGLKEVYIPVGCTAIAGNTFNTAASDCVFYFTGTKNQLDTLLSSANTNTNNTAILNAYNQAKSVDEFNAIEAKDGRYIVYGCNICDAFYGGKCDISTDDHDCTTALNCTRAGCGRVALEASGGHSEAHDVIYENGFLAAGVHKLYCTNENCTVINDDEELEPMFTAEGYSYKLNSANNAGISAKFGINNYALKLYEEYEGDIHYGIFAVNKNSLNDGAFTVNGKLNSEKGIYVEVTSNAYSYFTCTVNGFSGSDAHKALGLVIAGYVYETDEDGNVGKVTYVQKSYASDDENEASSAYTEMLEKSDATLGVVTVGRVEAHHNYISNK